MLIWGMGKNKWVLEQISTLQFMVTDAWKLSSKPLGLGGPAFAGPAGAAGLGGT